MVTYLKIIDALKAFALAHPQINTFYSGKTWNFESTENLYPAMIVFPSTTTIVKGETDINLNIIIVDIMNKDVTNKDDIYSDTLQTMQDVFSLLNNTDEDYFISDSGFSCDPLEEVFDDILCGWISNTTIKFPFQANYCLIPS